MSQTFAELEASGRSLRALRRSDVSEVEALRVLNTYFMPVIGDMDIEAIRASHILLACEPHLDKLDTIRKGVGQVRRILQEGLDDLGLALPNAGKIALGRLPVPHRGQYAPIQHKPSLDLDVLPDFIRYLREKSTHREGFKKSLALQLVILTATRANMVCGATVGEFNLDKNLWTVPACRMKAGRDEFVVPLASRAREIVVHMICGRNDPGAYLFTARGYAGKTDGPLPDKSLLDLQVGWTDRYGVQICTHGFRTTFKQWTSREGIPLDVAEDCLSHVVRDKTRAAYEREPAIERRANVLTMWQDAIL